MSRDLCAACYRFIYAQSPDARRSLLVIDSRSFSYWSGQLWLWSDTQSLLTTLISIWLFPVSLTQIPPAWSPFWKQCWVYMFCGRVFEGSGCQLLPWLNCKAWVLLDQFALLSRETILKIVKNCLFSPILSGWGLQFLNISRIYIYISTTRMCL